jgi:hypothetical protein
MPPYTNGGVILLDAAYAPGHEPRYAISVQPSTDDTLCFILSNRSYDPRTREADVSYIAQVYLDAESGYALLDHLKAILPIRVTA